MNSRLLTLILPAILCVCAHAADGKHLFILSGQSNMEGLNHKKSFVPVVEKAFGKDGVIVVKDALGGRPIRKWYKKWRSKDGQAHDSNGSNGKLYDRLMEKVMTAIQGEKLATVTFVWMQGERDAKESHGEVYAESFKGVLDQLRKDLKRDDIFFVIGRISDFDLENKRYPHWTMVREVQVALAEADPMGAWVDTDDWNGGNDGLHYNGAGYQKLGEAFAKSAIDLIKK